MKFTIYSAVLALIMAGATFLMAVLVRKFPDIWRKLPREKTVGIIITAIALIWAELHGEQMLSDFLDKDSVWMVKLLIPIILVMSYMFLEYIFTRAMGGLLVLLAVRGMEEAFIVNPPARFILSIFCYFWGVYALFMIGMPWIFRDCLRKAADSEKFRLAALGLSGSSLLVYFVFFIISLT